MTARYAALSIAGALALSSSTLRAQSPPAEPIASDGGLSELCAIDPSACVQVDVERAAARELNPEIYAMPLGPPPRTLRFELATYGAMTVDDLRNPSVGARTSFYVTRALAVGILGAFHPASASDTSGALYRWNASGDVLYVLSEGRLPIAPGIRYELVIEGGIGAMSVRSDARRDVEWRAHAAFNAGLELRVQLTHWMGAHLGLRDFLMVIQETDPQSSSDAGLRNSLQTYLGISFRTPRVVDQLSRK